MYSGNMGVAHRFDDILEVAGRLKDVPEVVFVFVGGGTREGEIATFRERHGLSNIRLLPAQEREHLADSLGAADVHFVTLRSGFEGLVVPSKAYGVMAVGRPILYQGNPEGEIARMVERHGAGIVVPDADVDGLEAAVRRLLANPEEAAHLGDRARTVLVKEFGRAKGLLAYEEALRG
jgi:glycosyltransferase involved in cell wall biosynthesis